MGAKAVVFTAPNKVEVRAVRCPDPGPGDAVVRVRQSRVSNGTEGSYLRGERADGDTPLRPGDPAPFPVVGGYQKVGTVEAVATASTTGALGPLVTHTLPLTRHQEGVELLRSKQAIKVLFTPG